MAHGIKEPARTADFVFLETRGQEPIEQAFGLVRNRIEP
jgi:hypothetical protein